MKKTRILTILIALLLVCSMLLLTACKKDKQVVEDVPDGVAAEQAATAVKNVFEGALKATYPTDVNVETAKKGASVKVAVDNDELGGKYEIDFVYDNNAKKMSATFDGTIERHHLTANLFVDNGEFVVSAPTLVTGAYGFNLNTLEEDLDGSYIASLLGNETDVIKQVAGILKSLLENDASSFLSLDNELYQKLKKDITDYLNNHSKTVKLQSFDLHDGKVDGFKVSFELNTDDLVELIKIVKADASAICEKLIEELNSSELLALIGGLQKLNGLTREIESDLDRLASEIKEALPNFKIQVDLGIKLPGKEVVCADIVLYKDATKTDGAKVSLSMDLGKDPAQSEKYLLTGKVVEETTTYDANGRTDGTNEIELSAEYLRTEKSGALKRELTLKATERSGDDVTEDHSLVISFDQNKSTGDYVLELITKDEQTGYTDVDMQLNGNLVVTKTGLKLSLDQFVESGRATKIGVSVEVETANVRVADKPSYTNIFKLTADDITKLAEELNKNIF